jgi:universal stress protein A
MYKRILCTTDFSACSQDALEQALRLAEVFGSKIDLMHVWQLPMYVMPDIIGGAPISPRVLEDAAREASERELTKWLKTNQARTKVPISSVLESGHPRDAILQRANSGDYDLLVLGTHGRTGLKHLLLGSVAEGVIRQAKCPVLVVRGQPIESDTDAS